MEWIELGCEKNWVDWSDNGCSGNGLWQQLYFIDCECVERSEAMPKGTTKIGVGDFLRGIEIGLD